MGDVLGLSSLFSGDAGATKEVGRATAATNLATGIVDAFQRDNESRVGLLLGNQSNVQTQANNLLAAMNRAGSGLSTTISAHNEGTANRYAYDIQKARTMLDAYKAQRQEDRKDFLLGNLYPGSGNIYDNSNARTGQLRISGAGTPDDIVNQVVAPNHSAFGTGRRIVPTSQLTNATSAAQRALQNVVQFDAITQNDTDTFTDLNTGARRNIRDELYQRAFDAYDAQQRQILGQFKQNDHQTLLAQFDNADQFGNEAYDTQFRDAFRQGAVLGSAAPSDLYFAGFDIGYQ